ncbi:MAG: hypothetical protein JXK08_07725 [Flavobacteriaceae bacterium]|nr:hypothetical protein [Flavobacteriaceae bacterium]
MKQIIFVMIGLVAVVTFIIVGLLSLIIHLFDTSSQQKENIILFQIISNKNQLLKHIYD